MNSKVIDVVDWLKKNHETKITTDGASNTRLDILVENCGRVNYADVDSPIFNEQRKGRHFDVIRLTQSHTVVPLLFHLEDIIGNFEWVGWHQEDLAHILIWLLA